MNRADPFRYWLPPLLWACLILTLSGRPGASESSGGWLELILSRTVGEVSSGTFEVLHFTVRKSIHVVAYAILGALNFRALRARAQGFRRRWALGAVGLALAVAILDETLQSSYASRTGSANDVVLDCIGALIAQIFYGWRRSR